MTRAQEPAILELPFWKVESIGNDFVLVHLDDVETARGQDPTDKFLEDLAIRVSRRRFGIGSDGLLAIAREADGQLLLRMFNPDGTEDFCGNGIRCGLDHALRQHWVGPDMMRMTHLGRSVTGIAIELREKQAAEEGSISPKARYLVEFELPPASYSPADVPINRDKEAFDAPLFLIDGKEYSGSVLSTGTAHTILPVDKLPDDEEFFRASPQVECHSIFPERTSVMWTHELDADKIELRIWERGVGETKGCGSGATAAAIDYLRRQTRGGSVEVLSPGGSLVITADSWTSPPKVSGIAAERFTGVIPVLTRLSL